MTDSLRGSSHMSALKSHTPKTNKAIKKIKKNGINSVRF